MILTLHLFENYQIRLILWIHYNNLAKAILAILPTSKGSQNYFFLSKITISNSNKLNNDKILKILFPIQGDAINKISENFCFIGSRFSDPKGSGLGRSWL